MSDAGEQRQKRPATALDEVLREIEEAENRVVDPEDDEEEHGGEAGEAITPNTRAQEQSEGE